MTRHSRSRHAGPERRPRNGALARLLSVLFAQQSEVRRAPACRARRTHFEPLESRVLLSATPAIVDPELMQDEPEGVAIHATLAAEPADLPVAMNLPPTAIDDAVAVPEDQTIFVSYASLLANDKDPERDPLEVLGISFVKDLAVAADVENGVPGLRISSNVADYNGAGSLRYTIGDGRGGTDDATLWVTITPVDDAPRLVTALPDMEIDPAGPTSIKLPADAFADADGDPLLYRLVLADGGALPNWLAFDPAARVLSGTPPRDFTGALSIRVLAIQQPEVLALPTVLSTGELVVGFTGSPLLALEAQSDTGTPGDGITRDRTPTFVGQAPVGAAGVRVRIELPDGTALQPTVVVPVAADGSWRYAVSDYIGTPRQREAVVIAQAVNASGTALPANPLTRAALDLSFVGSPLLGVEGVPDPTDRTPTLVGDALPGATSVALRFLDVNFRELLSPATAPIGPDGTWTYTLVKPIPFDNLLVEATAVDANGTALVSPWNGASMLMSFSGSPLLELAPGSDTDVPGNFVTRDRTPTFQGLATESAAAIELVITDDATNAELLRATEPVGADGRWTFTPSAPLTLARSATLTVSAWALDETGRRLTAHALNREGFDLTLVGSPLIVLAPESDTGALGDGITDDRTPTVFGEAPAGAASVRLEFVDFAFRPLRPGVVVAVDADGTWRHAPDDPFGETAVTFFATALDAVGNPLVAPEVLGMGTAGARFSGSPLLKLDPASDTDAPGDGVTRDRTPTFFGEAPPDAAGVLLEFLGPSNEALAPSVVVSTGEGGQWSYALSKPFEGSRAAVEVRVVATAVNAKGDPLGLGAINRHAIELVVRGSPLVSLDPASDTGEPFDGQTADRSPLLVGEASAGADLVLLSVRDWFNLEPVLDPVAVPVMAGQWQYRLPVRPELRIAVEATAIDIDGRFADDVFELSAIVPNRAPVITPIAAPSVGELQWLTVDVDASDADGDALTFELVAGPEGAYIHPETGVILWQAPGLVPAGPVKFTVRASDGELSDERTFEATVRPELLRVASQTFDASGVVVRFNRVFDASVINLYDGIGGPAGVRLGAADVRLTTLSGVVQPGTLLVHGDQQGFSFVRSGAPLADGDYRLAVVSGASAFKDLNGRALDGDGNGVAGGDYVATVRAGVPAGARIGVADFMRGPGQPVNLPANAAGLPVRLSGAGVAPNAQITFRLVYDPTLLEVSDVVAPVAGMTLTRSFGTTPDGLAYVDVALTAPAAGFAAGAQIARIVATVPAGAPYGATQRLDMRDARIDGVAVTDDDGIQVVGWLGDATGDAAYTNDDVARLIRVPAGADAGLHAWPRVDPNIIGDFNNDGRLSVLDPLILRAEVSGFDRPEIPPLPVPPAAIMFHAPVQQPDVTLPPPATFPTATLSLQEVAPLAYAGGESPTVAAQAAAPPTIDWRPSEMLTPLRTPPRAGWIADLLAGKGFKSAQSQTWSVSARR